MRDREKEGLSKAGGSAGDVTNGEKKTPDEKQCAMDMMGHGRVCVCVLEGVLERERKKKKMSYDEDS
jgi:hypothetical protein